MRTLAILAAAALVALAGCTTTAPPAPSTTTTTTSSAPSATASSYMLMVMDFPTQPIAAGAEFHFNDHIMGDATRTSDHIGAHFGGNHTTAPSTTAYPTTCVHTHGDLPGVYAVSCTAPSTPGTYYLRGHARITQGNSTVSWWSDEITFTVA